MFHNTFRCFNYYNTIPPTQFAQIWQTLSALCTMRTGCKWAPESGLTKCVWTPNVTQDMRWQSVNFALEERLRSVTKAETNLVLTENLHPAAETLPSLENQDMVQVGGTSLCCFSYRWSNPNIAGYFWGISHYPHPNIEGWLFKCIRQSFLSCLK
jgi:hypothetical protein